MRRSCGAIQGANFYPLYHQLPTVGADFDSLFCRARLRWFMISGDNPEDRREDQQEVNVE